MFDKCPSATIQAQQPQPDHQMPKSTNVIGQYPQFQRSTESVHLLAEKDNEEDCDQSGFELIFGQHRKTPEIHGGV